MRVHVPAVEYQTFHWVPKHAQIFSNAEVRRQTGPYRAAIPATLKDVSILIDPETSMELERSALAIKQFDSYAAEMLPPHSADLAPMSAILLRTESASSSQIEQLSTSAKQLALVEINEGSKRNAVTVLGNVRAMEAANLDTLLKMHFELLSHQIDMEEEAGKLRRELVWIGGSDTAGPLGASYIAPQHDVVPKALEDLFFFINHSRLPIVAKIAIAHAQFETIHPFVDGNGRTGRALAHSMLRSSQLSTRTTIPLSAGVLRNIDGYFEALSAYREGDAGKIIEVFAQAARYASFAGKQLVDSLAQAIADSGQKLKSVRSDSTAFKLLPLLIAQPVINTAYVRKALGVADATALRAIGALVEHGVLKETSGQARHRVWQHTGILAALDSFAAQLRRDTLHR